MCAINGIFAYHSSAPPADRAELRVVRDQMLSRGPDGHGEWFSDNMRTALGHRRLSIMDLTEAGAQPMDSLDGKLVIIFNGEIYNYRELRKELEAKGYVFRSQSDTEVLLHLYADRGEAMLPQLRGMFAFALWDDRKQGLLLARDSFGIKPLYIADDGKTFRFASQVKALLKGGNIDTVSEPAGHVGFYLWGHVPEPYTLYKGIRALPAGSSLWVDAAGHKEIKHFFNITNELANVSETRLILSSEEMRENIHAALIGSVRHHLIADVPVGVFLSAGIDSSTLVALAKEAAISELYTVTLGFKEFQNTEKDEVPLAELVAQHYSTKHITCWIAKKDFQRERPFLLDAMDQPSIDGLNSYLVSKAAKDIGLKVMLSGVGGDELFGGYPSFKNIPQMVKTFNHFQFMPLLGKGFRYISGSILSHFTSPKYAGLLEYGGTFDGAYLLRRGMYMPWELPKVLDGDMVRQGWAELQTLSQLKQTTRGVKNTHLKITALETAWYMRNQLLRDMDWASMAHSVEIRTPLVDVELFRTVAPLLNSTNPPSKYTMTENLKIPLPEKIKNRSKTGFSVPLQEWLRSNEVKEGGVREYAKDVYGSVKIPQKNILALVTESFGGYGGIALYNRDLLIALTTSSDVNEVTVFPRLIHNTLEKIPKKLCFVYESAGGKLRYILKILQYLFKKPQIDLIICAHINLLPLAFFLRLWFGKPVLLEIYGVDAWTPNKSRLVNFLVRRVDAIISISDITKQKFMVWTNYSKEKIFILPNAIHSELYGIEPKNSALLARYGLDGKKVLMTFGRLESKERYKGFDQILEILPLMAQKNRDIVYLIGGFGDDRARLEEKAKKLGVSDRVVFTGMIAEEEKADHYRLADVYVMPSQGEGFGFVLLEAMACGIPVIASKKDGGREALQEGRLGTLVDPNNSLEIIHAIDCALANSKKIPEGLQYFNFANFEQKTHQIMSKIIPGKKEMIGK